MKYLLLLFLFTASTASAEEVLKFRPDYWTKGLHLNAGMGPQSTYFVSDRRYNGIGYGVNFKTDLGYFFTNRFAIEWSTNAKFNSLNDFLIWDTLITGGIRYRIKEYFVRLFYGRAPTVVFFNGNIPEEYKGTKASRLQFDGPVYGLGFGRYYKTKKAGIWFLETAGTFQRLKEREAIYMRGEVPEIVAREEDRSTVFSLLFTVGMLVF